MIDKLVGDAVHAFFNAPLDLPDHPRRAVECAIAVRAWAQGYRSRPEPAAIGFGRTRIGIETGPVIVGDVGIRAKLNQLQTAALIQRAKAGELRAYLGSWGSYSINDVSAILPNFFDGGADDYARDPDVQKWLVEGGSSINPEVRKEAYSMAIKKITEQAYWAPLHTYVTTYGHAKQLAFTPYPDELPRFYLAKWN